jgi:choline dehydrogenase-like flavoprotein
VRILVVGSGPSGVHFTLTALRKGHSVTMLDVGNARPPIAAPAASFLGLKHELGDPAAYFLGKDYGGITLPSPAPGQGKEYYGLPPSKDYVFAASPQFRFMNDGFAPLFSFAAGGLAECWTAGSYALDDVDLAEFPFRYSDIEPYYSEVASRIGVGGENDDIGFPQHDHLSAPTPLDSNAASLLARYERRRELLKSKHAVRLGRSRQAVLTAARGEREACRACGRCLWGCPNGALYTPSITLRECLSHATFDYRPGLFVSHFEAEADGALSVAWAYPVAGGAPEKFSADVYVLAAGALSSSNIVLRTHYKATGEIVRLEGLMDNRQVLAPFFNFAMLGRPYSADSYQYHQLAFGLLQAPPRHYVHGQITTLKTAAAHPVLQNLPLDMKTAAGVFRALRSGLGIANLNYCDTRRSGNFLTLAENGAEWPVLLARYRPAPDETAEIRRTLREVRRFFADLGAPLVPGMTHVRPVGSGVHYGGTLPMSLEKRAWAVSPECRSYDFSNLFVVDGATFPFMPAKNLTFTLMANATRLADLAL